MLKNVAQRRTNNIDEVNFEVTGKHAVVILMPEETRHIILAGSFFRSFRTEN